MATKYVCPKCKKKHSLRSSAVSCCSRSYGSDYDASSMVIDTVFESGSSYSDGGSFGGGFSDGGSCGGGDGGGSC